MSGALAVEEVGRAELERQRLLLRLGVDGDDRRRSLHLERLEHVEADTADAEHDRSVGRRLTLARLNTAPMPVTTPQPTRAADVNGTSSSIFTHCVSRTSVCSPNALVEAKLQIRSPSIVNGCVRAPSVLRQRAGCPSPQALHRPHEARVAMRMWSPSCTWVTAEPTLSTIPAPSWPHTAGAGTTVVEAGHEADVAVAEPGRRHLDDDLAWARVAHLQVVDQLGLRAVVDDSSHPRPLQVGGPHGRGRAYLTPRQTDQPGSRITAGRCR